MDRRKLDRCTRIIASMQCKPVLNIVAQKKAYAVAYNQEFSMFWHKFFYFSLNRDNTKRTMTVYIYYVCRLISNYELHKDSVVGQKILLSHAQSCGVSVSKQFCGRVISRIWGDKIVKSRRKGIDPGFLHLRHRPYCDRERRPILKFDDESVEDIRCLLENDQWPY